MITKAELIRIARKQKLPLGLVEKDFILTFILNEIYKSQLKDSLAFKGGTALHKLYLHKRLSVDLDFTALNGFDINILKGILTIKEINSEVKKTVTNEKSISMDLKYVSILNYPDSIKVDISLREKPLLKTKEIALNSPYFEGFAVMTFQIAEIAAEKIRALMQRKRPRDYFDMWLLLKEIKFEDFKDIANKKLKAANDIFDTNRIFTDLETVRALWKDDLRQLIPELPEFGIVISDIKRDLRLHP